MPRCLYSCRQPGGPGAHGPPVPPATGPAAAVGSYYPARGSARLLVVYYTTLHDGCSVFFVETAEASGLDFRRTVHMLSIHEHMATCSTGSELCSDLFKLNLLGCKFD